MTYDEDEESYSDDDDFEQHPKTFFTKFTPSDKYSPQQEHPRGRGYNDSRRSAPGRDGGRGRGRGRSTQPDRSAGFDRTRPKRRPTSEPPRKNKEQCSVCKTFGHGPHEDDCWLLPRILCATEWIKNNTSKCPSIMSRYTKTNSMNYRQQVTNHLVRTNQVRVEDQDKFLLTDELDDFIAFHALTSSTHHEDKL